MFLYALYIIHTCVEYYQLHQELQNLSYDMLSVEIEIIDGKPSYTQNNFLQNFFSIIKNTKQSMFLVYFICELDIKKYTILS